jgi:hypothetical protein
MATARGKYAYGICDKTGFRYKLNELVFEVRNGIKTGLRVGRDVADPDHPQNHLGRVRTNDPQSIRDARPDRREPEAISMLASDPFTTGSLGSSVVTVIETNHGRDTGDVVRFRGCEGFDGIAKSDIESASGYSITKVNADTYTVTVSGTASAGNKNGGGPLCSAGPVTPSA